MGVKSQLIEIVVKLNGLEILHYSVAAFTVDQQQLTS